MKESGHVKERSTWLMVAIVQPIPDLPDQQARDSCRSKLSIWKPMCTSVKHGSLSLIRALVVPRAPWQDDESHRHTTRGVETPCTWKVRAWVRITASRT
jgi:hypothetical protein